MIHTDESALICDFAETYNIYDYKALPVSLLAVLSCGLRSNSRIKMKMDGLPSEFDNMLLSVIADGINTIVWMISDGSSDRPGSIFSALSGKDDDADSKSMAFDSPETYEAERKRLLQKIKEGE